MQQAIHDQVLSAARDVEDQLDSQLHALNKLDEDDMEDMRRKRLEQMKHMAKKKQEWINKGHGEYREIDGEKNFFSEMKGEARMVCHFFRNNWPCKVSVKLFASSSHGLPSALATLCHALQQEVPAAPQAHLLCRQLRVLSIARGALTFSCMEQRCLCKAQRQAGSCEMRN